ncbi:MAG TPA: metallophosphoesterase [Actinomycetota bacterium]|nr:metallophosphoesterase [Actinomycetota bacterium]
MQPLLAALGLATAAAYPFVEARWYRLKHVDVPVARAVPRVTILHISDTHLNAKDASLMRFLESLPARVGRPDIAVATGDLIEDDSGIEPIAAALNGIEATIGRFYVLGSHDYYQTQFQSYLKYFGKRAPGMRAPFADTDRLEQLLRAEGWVGLTNTTAVVDTPHGKMRFAGVDDPYLKRQDIHHVERAAGEVLAVGLTHSPDVVSEWMLRGFDLVLSGHTHAGQVRFPLVGPLVTNSSLPTTLAGGLHPIGNAYLHVSPGLGTGRFAPIRFNCRPEATLLRVASDGAGDGRAG